MQIGSVIRKYRKECGLTQEEMAKRLGVTTPAVNKWENGNESRYRTVGTDCPAVAYFTRHTVVFSGKTDGHGD